MWNHQCHRFSLFFGYVVRIKEMSRNPKFQLHMFYGWSYANLKIWQKTDPNFTDQTFKWLKLVIGWADLLQIFITAEHP